MPDAFRLEIGADRTRAYAELAGDFNPLHLDPEFAAKTPFGTVIVHGSYTLALVVDRLERAGFGPLNRVEMRFTAPVPVGTTVALHLTPGEGQVSVSLTDGATKEFLQGSAVCTALDVTEQGNTK